MSIILPSGYARDADELLEVYSRKDVLVFDQSAFKEHGYCVFKTGASAKKYLTHSICRLYPKLSLHDLSLIRVEKARICVGVLWRPTGRPQVARVSAFYLNYLPSDDSCFATIVCEPYDNHCN